MSKVHKYRPRTKHINVKLYHFREYVEQNKILIKSIGTSEQLDDCLTKSLERSTIEKLRKTMIG